MAHSYAVADQIGSELCKVLKLENQGVIGFSFRIYTRELATVTVDSLLRLVTRYAVHCTSSLRCDCLTTSCLRSAASITEVAAVPTESKEA